jgi:flagellar biosynthesis protein FlhG
MTELNRIEAATRLDIDPDMVGILLRQNRAALPAFDPDDLDHIPVAVIEALGQILAPHRVTPQDEDVLQGRRKPLMTDGAPIFTVTSGKGGVGKTSLCVNLAAELAGRGHRTLLIDVDLGLANAHILTGVQPAYTLTDFLSGRAALPDVVVDGPNGVKMIAGGSGVKEIADLDATGRDKILEAVEQLRPHCDVILLDTGAGISDGVTDFVSIADHALVVTTSNFAAIADAYGIVKVLVQAGFRRDMHLIVNRVRSPEEAKQVFQKLDGCTARFLEARLNWLGLLPEDHSVEGAVLKRTPFTQAFPESVAARYLRKLATSLERYLQSTPSGAR